VIGDRRGGGFNANIHNLSGEIVRKVESGVYPLKYGLKRTSQRSQLTESGI